MRADCQPRTPSIAERQLTFKGTLSADASSFQGTVTYHNGQQFPMTGTRR
jgi:hypothetical protein